MSPIFGVFASDSDFSSNGFSPSSPMCSTSFGGFSWGLIVGLYELSGAGVDLFAGSCKIAGGELTSELMLARMTGSRKENLPPNFSTSFLGIRPTASSLFFWTSLAFWLPLSTTTGSWSFPDLLSFDFVDFPLWSLLIGWDRRGLTPNLSSMWLDFTFPKFNILRVCSSK